MRPRPRATLVAAVLLAVGAGPVLAAVSSRSAGPLHLNIEERAWLDRHPVISFGVNDFPPLIFSDRDGSPTGIGVEYSELVAKRLGVKAKWIRYPTWRAEVDALRDGGLDVAPTMANGEIPDGLTAGEPWMFLTGAIVTRRDAPRITGIKDFADQVVAVQKISPGEMEISERSPKQKLLLTESVPEILDAVVTGKAAAGVGMLAVIDYAIRNEGYGNSLKLAAPFGERDVPVRMLVAGDARILSGILDKSIATVTDAERQQILSHWFTTSLKGGLDPVRVLRVALTVALPIVAVLALMLYWTERLRREVRWRKAAQLQADAQAEELKRAKAELDHVLKRTSSQFQAILDNAPLAAWAKDIDGVYLLANNGYRQMFDVGDRDIIGARDEAFFSREEAENFRRNDRTVIHEKRTASYVEPILRRDGRRQTVLSVKFPLLDDHGQAYAAAGISADITQQIELQEELKHLNQDLALREQQLLRISKSPVVDAGDLGETYKLVASAVCAGLNVQRASIWFWDDTRSAIVCQLLLDRGKGFSAEPTRLARDDFPRYFATLDQGRAILAHSAATDDATMEFALPYLQPLGITSMLDVGIRHGGDTVGVLCCEHTGPARKWREEEGFFASALADLVGRALTAESRVRAEAELKELLVTLEQRVAERTVEAQQARATAESSRSRLLDITDNVPGVVFEFIRAADGGYSAPFVSAGIEELVGLSSQAVTEDVGRYFATVLPEDRPDYLASIEQSATLGGEVRKSFRIRHARSGEIRWLSVHALPPHREQGITNWRGYVSDITEQKRLEAELEQALEWAQAAERAKGDFLANMSHEIRTPMNAIIGMSHLALQTELSPRQLNYITKIDAAAKSLLGIINDILDVSKIEAGKLTLEKADFCLHELFDNLTTMIGQKMQQKGLELLFDIDLRIPDALVGDSVRLSQVLTNLCSNAVKFTETGEIVVSAQLLESAGTQRLIRFAVKDSGIGLTPQQISRLFQPFEQGDASTTRKYGGTGLGLTIAKRISEMMGGGIGVESEPGRGSTFWFTARVEISRSTAAASTTGVGDLHVLVVDDNPVAREILASLAASLKLRVSAVASGEEAIRALTNATSPYDIVLTDWKMPGMSGAQLIRTIKRDMKLANVPLAILVTGYGSEDALQDLGDVRGDGLLMKPVSASSLFDTIQHALGRDSGLPPGRARKATVAAVPRFEGVRMLLVEDNEVNREVAQEILQQTGATISIASNGREAVDAVAPGKFDVVLMDMQMPVMDGDEATRILRRNPALSDLPIIAITANAMAGDRERFLACGVNDHVIKPIDVPELFAVLTRWVRPRDAEGASPAMSPRTERQTAGPLPSTTPIAIPAIEGVDIAQGLERVNGDPVIYLRILKKFCDGHANAVARIRAALDREDYDGAMREAHAVTGAAGNIGATALFVAASAVETACRSRAPAGTIGLQAMEAALTVLTTAVMHCVEPVQNVVEPVPPVSDLALIATRMRELKLRLDEYDASASDTLDALSSLLGGDGRIEQIRKHLDRYDFRSAAAAAEALARNLGISIIPAEQEGR